MPKIGHATKDENGKYKNGTSGDQTKVEVYIREWYNRPWSHIIRAKDKDMREKLAKDMEYSCNNDLLGYDQNQRNSALVLARKVGYNMSKIKATCEVDCSSLVCICCMYAGILESVLYVNNNCSVTSNLRRRLMSTNKFDTLTDKKYLSSGDYLLRGDILLYEGHHVAICLEDGSKVSDVIKVNTNPKLGIDVSSYQGTIDWAKVKANGCNFAILKIIRKDLTKDKSFEDNVIGCDKNNLTWDVYNYSYASTVNKFISDANVVIKALNGRKCTVWLDIEDKVQKGIGQVLIDGILAYQKVIESSGCKFGVYTGLSFYNSYIRPYAKQLTCPFWIARYYNGYNEMYFGVTPNEAYKPNIDNILYGWQFTSSGKINGIQGNVDVNIVYDIANKGTVIANTLNIREKPTKDSTDIGDLHKGDIVDILNYVDGWYYISIGNKQGWASKNYIV